MLFIQKMKHTVFFFFFVVMKQYFGNLLLVSRLLKKTDK